MWTRYQVEFKNKIIFARVKYQKEWLLSNFSLHRNENSPLPVIIKNQIDQPFGISLFDIQSHWEFAGFKENILYPETSLVCNTSATPALRVGETSLFGTATSHWDACPLRTGKDAENHSAHSWMSPLRLPL